MLSRFPPLLLISCVPLSIGPALGQVSAPQQAIVCETKELTVEPACKTKLKGMFARDGDKLTINLDGGKTKRYIGNRAACEADNVDKCLVFRMERYFPKIRSYLITKGYYEGADYLLVSQRTGSETIVSDILTLSPNAKFLIAIDQNDAGERDFDIAVWSMDSDPPKQEFKYKAERYENWEVTAWNDDTNVNVKAWVNDKTSFDQEARLVRTDKGLDIGSGQEDRPAAIAICGSTARRSLDLVDRASIWRDVCRCGRFLTLQGLAPPLLYCLS